MRVNFASLRCKQTDKQIRKPRINTDWFPKRGPREKASRRARRHAPPPPVICLNFDSLKFPFQGFWFNLESFIIIKNIFIVFLLFFWPISGKRWKPVWIRACVSENVSSLRGRGPTVRKIIYRYPGNTSIKWLSVYIAGSNWNLNEF